MWLRHGGCAAHGDYSGVVFGQGARTAFRYGLVDEGRRAPKYDCDEKEREREREMGERDGRERWERWWWWVRDFIC